MTYLDINRFKYLKFFVNALYIITNKIKLMLISQHFKNLVGKELYAFVLLKCQK